MIQEPALPDRFTREILRCEVGSGLHGTGLEGQEDFDMMGIALETLQTTIMEQPKTWQWRTQPEGSPSGPGDIDLQVHPLRKYVQLAMHGNPSIILLLFVPDSHTQIKTTEGAELQALAPAFHSRHAAARYLGYLNAQRERLLGIRRGRGPRENRPEVSKWGYDSKYAMHSVRLGYQGIEFLATGKVTEPMVGSERDICLAIRKGEWPLSEVTDLIESLEIHLHNLQDDSDIPPDPDRKRIVEWISDVQLKEWS